MDYLLDKKLRGLILILLAAAKISNAQFTYNLSKYEIGAQVGGLVSRTSLTPENLGAYKQMHPSVGVFAQGPLFNPFSIRASLTIGQIGSDDSKVNDPRYTFLQLRNFKYLTTMAELSTIIVLNLVKEHYNLFTHEHSHRFTPYLFGGIGFSYVNVKRSWSGIDIAYLANTPYVTNLALDTVPSTVPTIITVFPMGMGVRYAVNPQIALFTELNFRYNFEHYLDGFNYATNRPNSKDFFYGITIGISYRPISNDYRNDCPKSVL